MSGHLSAAVTLGKILQSCGDVICAVWSHGRRAVWLDAFDSVGMCWPEKTDEAWGYVAFCVGLTVVVGPTVIGESAKRSGKLNTPL